MVWVYGILICQDIFLGGTTCKTQRIFMPVTKKLVIFDQINIFLLNFSFTSRQVSPISLRICKLDLTDTLIKSLID